MKKLLPVLFLSAILSFIALPSLNAQNSETRSLGSFTGISVSTSVTATIQKGATNSVDITATGIDLDKVKTEIDNGVLKVGVKNKGSNWSWLKKTKVEVTVTYSDDPEYLSVSSSGDIIGTDVIRSKKLNLSASSSGDMKIEIDVEELEASASSSADLMISGSAAKAEIKASSSADFLGKKLNVGHADLSASSSADIEVRVEESIDASASSSGDITYWGNPQKNNVSKRSSGDITHRKG